jgi:hypothetical protein
VTAVPRAADLPDDSVVLDDLRGIAWYANGAPGEEDRWDATGSEVRSDDSAVDWALAHGAEVLRVGTGREES